ncbi:MAG: 1-acyl-sn-glycerol-3-phosphate acyltransferase [Desulfobacteraceae bacterium]|nr:MAG: 1-acyl-sn-glycerol-3-phosphate acyltransferase [Desulfobacteraceae bacterium]
MTFLKNVIIWIFAVAHTAFFSVFGIVLSWFDNSGRLTHFYSAKPWGSGILWAGRVKVLVQGLENIQKGAPYILMANHQSFFDIFSLLAKLPVDFKFILKKELLSIPVFGYCMKRAGYIAINRKDSRTAIKSIEDTVTRIQNGTSILIFPEGTRSSEGQLQDFKKGGFHLALKSGCAILPIGINQSYKIMSKGSFLVNPGRFYMKVGKPIEVKEYQKQDLSALILHVRNTIAGLMEEAVDHPDNPARKASPISKK